MDCEEPAVNDLLRTGDTVHIAYGDESAVGMIIIGSRNGASLMLSFDAIIDGHVGMMPVLRGDDGIYRSIVTGTEVRITPAAPLH